MIDSTSKLKKKRNREWFTEVVTETMADTACHVGWVAATFFY